MPRPDSLSQDLSKSIGFELGCSTMPNLNVVQPHQVSDVCTTDREVSRSHSLFVKPLSSDQGDSPCVVAVGNDVNLTCK